MASPTKKLKSELTNPSVAETHLPTLIEKIKNNRQKCAKSVMDFPFIKKRIRILSKVEVVPESAQGILYWMSRDQRVNDNWSLLYSQKLAIKNKLPLHVAFCLVPKFLDATLRHYSFMLKGLEMVAKECKSLNICFHLLLGEPAKVLPFFVKEHKFGAVVVDFSPLRGPRKWVDEVQKAIPDDIPFCQVDSHNIVPCWVASDKLEYAARTIRNKINSKLGEYLTEFPPVVQHMYSATIKTKSVDWTAAEKTLDVDRTVQPVAWAQPGEVEGFKVLDRFITERLKNFASKRNDPNSDALSNLSPWFHFGHISVQRAILEVKKSKANSESVASFCEEAIIRRELSDNFCFYNEKYDSIEGTNNWAQQTLNQHRKDKREAIYTKLEFEQAKTHDDLWNSAQLQLVNEGKMHGFLRMYWAKKILEWTPNPEEALAISIYLNDRYSLDGRDPNGFVGCMWSICGVHDQGWAERAIFGKIRYMNYKGCQRKFDVPTYVARYGGKVHKQKK